MTYYANNLVFLDFEASSLTANSWPVEIGLSWLRDDGEVESHARLIRRHPTWSMDDWSEQSAAIHQIPSGILESKGLDAPDAAEWFLETAKGRLIGTDNPEFEAKWLRRLLEIGRDEVAVNRQIARLADFYALIQPLLSEAALDMYFERLRRLKAPHRAGPDSARFATALKAATDFDRKLSSMANSHL
jgi:DNA polymerase III subunit epsilon